LARNCSALARQASASSGNPVLFAVVEGVRPAMAAAGAAERAGAAGPGVGRRPAAPGAAGLLLPLAAAGVVLGALAGLLPGTLALPVGGLLAGVGAEATLAARVVRLAEAALAGGAGAVDDAHVHRSLTPPRLWRRGAARRRGGGCGRSWP
jgi:hypothetical protein